MRAIPSTAPAVSVPSTAPRNRLGVVAFVLAILPALICPFLVPATLDTLF
ncbi:MAG TPA: hypothetical protein VGM70_04705 [Pseudolysinimonas sp.]|jgi:hypothetical protein